MSNNGAALLGGLLIGGLVVGAAMSADNAAERQHQRNMRSYHQQQRQLKHSTFCICGAQMTQGRIQQGIAKCNNLNCQRVLTGSICYYCPNGGNVQQHRQGFFYCEQCAVAARRSGAKVVQQQVPAPQPQHVYPAKQPPKGQNYIVKQGYMNKKGEWFNTAYKKRWFKLWSNKKMAYLTHPGASYTKGYADFTAITKMQKKGKHGFEVHTKARVWTFLCASEQDRDSWFSTIQAVCMGIQPQVYAPQPMPQPPVQYVQAPPPQPQPQYIAQPQPQPQPQPQYVNGNVPQYAQPMQPQPMYAQPAPQPMYRGSVDQGHVQKKEELQPHYTRTASQSLQPGMVGYNAGNMYKSGNDNGNNNNNSNIAQQKWENDAPPAYADATAPPEDDLIPSAPPLEEENEGAYTGQ
eukprot:CAMPEP_0197074800 /NCGR_PEP_ID=MMETSP1384-20130603/211292_1 /TAXON_ID=29189 /ORGANISM="Ammonia sp." /LENGTH=405 /DNA_ID=CAMNT_0042513641 /DNA_START=70 /DNA_END=1287 /DNA_ORIENTATION=+